MLAFKQKLKQQQNKQQPSDQTLQQPTELISLPFNLTQLTQQGFGPLPNVQLNQQSALPIDNRSLSLDDCHEGSVLGSQMIQ